MGVFFSYLSRIWRKKSTLLALGLGFFIFLLCIHATSNSGSGTKSARHHSHHIPPAASALHKRLQQSFDEDDNDDNEVEDRHGVQFIPGVPGHSSKKKVPLELQSDEVEYFRNKNREMFQNQAREKALKSKKFVSRGDVQPSFDDNLEFNSDDKRMSDAVDAPIYREFVGQTAQDQAQGRDPSLPPYVPQRRLIHFDLKGAPPKVDYLLKILSLAKDLGATGVLMEYEDMFPFEGKLENVTATNAYTKAEVRQMLDKCRELELEVIPLIQTFGHLEFVLKLPQFAHLRDVAEMPESICPCHSEAMFVIKELVDQVLALHKPYDDIISSVHIGCDEVYHLGECEPCSGHGRSTIFVSHVSGVAHYVKDVHKKQPIIWDDMLRNFMPAEMEPLGVDGLVEPMVWVYAEDVYRFAPTYNWDHFAEVFPSAWTASAFKGAHGPTLAVPNAQRHLTNNLNWMELMGTEESKFKEGFRGIVITGWQRYDHFAVLCELLPTAVPSMAVDLLATKYGYFNSSLQSELFKSLECIGTSRSLDEPLEIETDPFLFDKMNLCYFPGHAIFKMARSLLTVEKEVAAFVKKVTKEQAWLTNYNVRRNFSSPYRVDELLDEWGMTFNTVNNLIRSAKTALSEVFDDFTVGEWIEQKLLPMYKQLQEIRKRGEALKMRKTWPRRPFPVLEDLQVNFMIGVSASEAPATRSPLLLGDENHRVVETETARPKRLVQAPDHYRHPPGYR